MENMEKSVCALQGSLYLVTCFSDTRHYEHTRLAVVVLEQSKVVGVPVLRNQYVLA